MFVNLHIIVLLQQRMYDHRNIELIF